MSERCLMWYYVEAGRAWWVPADEVFDTLAAMREWAENRTTPPLRHDLMEIQAAREVLEILNRSDPE